MKNLLVLLSLIVLVSCGDGKDKTITFLDGRYEITVPGNWNELDLHDEADFEYGNKFKENYVLVMSEHKSDLDDDFTLLNYSDLTAGSLAEALKNAKIISLADESANGMNLIKRQIMGTTENIKIKYFHITAEDEVYFHQILYWTLPSRYEKSLPHFEKSLSSFKRRLTNKI